MSNPTQEQVIAELRKRGRSSDEIRYAILDKQHKKYEDFLSTNVGLQEDENYKLVKKEYNNVLTERAKLFADMQARAADDPSVIKNLDAFIRAVNETGADVLGSPVDVTNFALQQVGLGSEEPLFGSKMLARSLQSMNMGYYDSSAPDRSIRSNQSEEKNDRVPAATIADMPPSTRPYAVAGEEAATSLALASPIAYAARLRTPLQIANMSKSAPSLREGIPGMIDFAAKNPDKFRNLESSVAVLSGVGGGIAETVAPGDPNARMIGSISGALSSTVLPLSAQASYKLLNKVSFGTVDKLKNAITLRFGGAETAVAKKFQEVIVAEGSDPKQLAKKIDDFIKQNPQYLNQQGNLSAGLATGDDTLLAIERSLIAGDKEISKKAAEQTANSILEMRKLYNSSLKISDSNPELVREIADARINQLNIITGLRVSKAVNKINLIESNLLQKSSPNVNFAKQEAAKEIKKIFDKTFEDLRTTESQLWNKIDKTIRLSGDETESALKNLSSDIDGLSGIALPTALKKMQSLNFNAKAGLSSVSSGDLLKARSDLGKQMRQAMSGAKPDRDLTRRLYNLQNAVTNDLSKGANSAQVRIANSASKNTYNFLDLNVVNKMAQRSFGGNLKKPDLVLDELLMGKSQPAFQTFFDLMLAGGKGAYSKQLRDPIAKFYHAMANDVVGQSGKVDLEKLGAFLTKHEVGLKALGLYDNIRKPEVQAHLVKKLQTSMAQLSNNFTSKSMAGKIIKNNNVNSHVSKILFESPSRNADLKLLVNLSRKKAPGVNNAKALEGIQQSFVENLLEQSIVKYTAPNAKVASDLISGQKILDALSKKQGKFSLEEDLISSKLIGRSQMDQIKAMAKRAKEFEESVLKRASGAKIEGIPPSSDYIVDIIGRLGGATFAAASPLGQGVGHELIIAQIGSQAGRTFLQKMPNAKLGDLMKEAMLDPVLMKRLLERPTSITARKSNDFQLRALMISKGLIEEREAYALEGSEAKSESLKSAIKTLAGRGKSKLEIMAHFEKKAREDGTNIGPYMLDQVQSILDISGKDRARMMQNYDIERKPYKLKRKYRN